MLLLRLSGLLLLRYVVRQFCGLLFQLPPRMTRLSPFGTYPFIFMSKYFFSNWLHQRAL
jgi:hypothetical protein